MARDSYGHMRSRQGMGHLVGLKAYLQEGYHLSVFDGAVSSETPWLLHVHGQHTVRAKIVENLTYDIRAASSGEDPEIIPKIQIKFLYPEEVQENVRGLLKIEGSVRAAGLEPILKPGPRFHIKNKTLFPLLKGETVVFFTLLEGEVVRGIISGFSRYEITVRLKGGVPVTLLRHAIYDLRDKRGRCYLKSFQEEHRDWEKSPLFLSASE